METIWPHSPKKREDPSQHGYEAVLQSNSRREKKFRGARRTTLPTVLNVDLTACQEKEHNYSKQIKLGNKSDLDTLLTIARDRKYWRCLVARVAGAGRAELSVDNSAEVH